MDLARRHGPGGGSSQKPRARAGASTWVRRGTDVKPENPLRRRRGSDDGHDPRAAADSGAEPLASVRTGEASGLQAAAGGGSQGGGAGAVPQAVSLLRWKLGEPVSPEARALEVQKQVDELTGELDAVKRQMKQLDSNLVQVSKEAYISWKDWVVGMEP